MPQSPPAGRCAVLLLLTVAACGPDAPPPPAPERAPVAQEPRRRTLRDTVRAPRPAPPRPDSVQPRAPAPLLVFDTLEAPPAPPPPRPPPERLPRPEARPPTPRAPVGSCDVRPAEDYCFAYTGPGWTPTEARTHCAAAPDATFRAGPCPTAERIATCTFRRPSDPARETVYSTYAPADLTLARLACPGEFTVID